MATTTSLTTTVGMTVINLISLQNFCCSQHFEDCCVSVSMIQIDVNRICTMVMCTKPKIICQYGEIRVACTHLHSFAGYLKTCAINHGCQFYSPH